MNSLPPQSPSGSDRAASPQENRPTTSPVVRTASSPENRTASSPENRCVLVCQHRTCLRHGAAEVMTAFADVTVPGVTIQASDCLGQCSIGPNARVLPDEIWYARLSPEDVAIIADEHLQGGQPVDRLLNPRIHLQPFTTY